MMRYTLRFAFVLFLLPIFLACHRSAPNESTEEFHGKIGKISPGGYSD